MISHSHVGCKELKKNNPETVKIYQIPCSVEAIVYLNYNILVKYITLRIYIFTIKYFHPLISLHFSVPKTCKKSPSISANFVEKYFHIIALFYIKR